jgi:hypothetical protein
MQHIGLPAAAAARQTQATDEKDRPDGRQASHAFPPPGKHVIEARDSGASSGMKSLERYLV